MGQECNQITKPDLPTYKGLIMDCINAVVKKEDFSGQQTFEIHWKDGILVDCYEVIRAKIRKGQEDGL